MKRLGIMLGLVFLFSAGNSYSEELKLDVQSFNEQVELFEVGHIIYMPEMHILFYYAPKLYESGVIYDLKSKEAFSVGKKGTGPDQFKAFRYAFTDGDYFYLYDIVSFKLLKYVVQENVTKLDDIILVKKLGMAFDFGERDFLGKMGDKWIVQNSVYRDLEDAYTNPSKFPLSIDSYIGIMDENFTDYEGLIQVKGKKFPQICESYDNYVCFVGGEHYLVQLTAVNCDPKKREMLVPVTHIETRETAAITIEIPEKYTYYQIKPWQESSDWRRRQSKYKYVPEGSRFFGLDDRYYFCYFHYNEDESFDILYNVLDFNSMTIRQYEQRKATMKPMLADTENIAFLKETDADTSELVLAPKKEILNSEMK